MTDFDKEEELTTDEELEAQQRLAERCYWYSCAYQECGFKSQNYLEYYKHKKDNPGHIVMIMSFDTEKVLEDLMRSRF